MKKIKLFITLLVTVTSVCSFGQSISDDKPKQKPVKFYIDYKNSIEKNDTLGHYFFDKNDISSNVFKHERSEGSDTLKGIILNFHGFLSSQDIISWIKQSGMRPATFKEIQVFGIEIGIDQNSGIVAFGSEVLSCGIKNVPLIINDKRGTTIELFPLEGKWNGSFYKLLCIFN